MTRSILILVFGLFSSGAFAMSPIKDESEFRSLIEGKTLVLRLYTIKLNVMQSGDILGSALGRKVTGDWRWSNGYFCRTMYWGKREIPYNCQLVSFDGQSMRFTTDKGAGEFADFELR